jgi:hypothetical protein
MNIILLICFQNPDTSIGKHAELKIASQLRNFISCHKESEFLLPSRCFLTNTCSDVIEILHIDQRNLFPASSTT